MTRPITWIAILWALIALASVASAGDLYVGAGASVAMESFDAKPHGVDVEHTNGWDFLLGYRFTPHFGLEAQMQTLQAFDIDGAAEGSVENASYSLAAKVYPFEGAVQPFLSAGFGLVNLRSHARVAGIGYASRAKLDEASTDWATAIGAGVDFPLGDRFTLELAGRYWLPADALRDFEFWTAGANLQFRF